MWKALEATVLALLLLGAGGCDDSTTRPVATREPAADSEYFSFGAILSVERPEALDMTNPHHIAQYSVHLCRQGQTTKMVQEIGHVEDDKDLGEAFLTFLRDFGPDLEKFKDKDLCLKFHGYKAGKDTSVWYYYLSTPQGNLLERKPFITLHRSNQSKMCALTGIFMALTDDEDETPMPDDLRTGR